ncbi:hypothetical protein N7481_007816 [Penicillium waksmanii]|uniref:uncharacterized protein n=1 Tax=Penicillium waksmanii TaxID=69791 RepID=UPI0025466319|nr:uncharacterized protein N7481_007816 [Penicillium waksmanii]KAJ5980518.1 hypothetical protein N7481_007816 [Penicillium waksmanii]
MEENPGSAGPVAVVRRRSESRSPMVDRGPRQGSRRNMTIGSWQHPGSPSFQISRFTHQQQHHVQQKHHHYTSTILVLTEHLHPIPTVLPGSADALASRGSPVHVDGSLALL